MWFKNIQTGHIWEITDEKLQEELKKNPDFEIVESPVKEKTSKRNNPNQTKDMKCEVCEKICKGQRSYTQHKRMAHGIEKDGDE